VFVRLFGLVFFAAGAWVMACILFGIGIVTVGDDPGRLANVGDIWLPGILAAIGLAIACVRYSEVIDGARRSKVCIIGWGFWYKTTETPVDLTAIEVGAIEERGQGSDRHLAIPVRAIGTGGAVELATRSSYRAARELAKRLAEVFDVPMGPRLPGWNDDPPRRGSGVPPQRSLAILHVDPADLTPPSWTAVTMESRGSGIAIHLPPPLPLNQVAIWAPFILLTIFSLMCLVPLNDVPGPYSRTAWIMLLAPPLLGICLTVAMAVRARFHVPVGPTIEVERGVGIRIGNQVIAADAIRGLEVLPGIGKDSGLLVVEDSREYLIARGLIHANLRYVRALILEHLRPR
jgi:hypothetical protein